MPNIFSFVVTPELEQIAKESLKGTPYGLVVVKGAYDWRAVNKADYLHKEKVRPNVIRKLLHKTSTETQSTRAELLIVSKSYQAAARRMVSSKCFLVRSNVSMGFVTAPAPSYICP